MGDRQKETPIRIMIRCPADLHEQLKHRADIEDLPMARVIVRTLRKEMRHWRKTSDDVDVDL